MTTPRNRHGTVGGLLGVGMAFLVIAFNGQAELVGVAMALIATGIVLLSKARRERCLP